MTSRKKIRAASPTVRAIFERAMEMNLTVAALAEKIDRSVQSVHRWRAGRNAPNILDIEELCGALGITVFVGDKDFVRNTPEFKNLQAEADRLWRQTHPERMGR